MKKLIYKYVFLAGICVSVLCIPIICIFIKNSSIAEAYVNKSAVMYASASVIVIFTVILCAVVSRILSNLLITGVEKINFEDPVYGDNFKELYPLISHLKEQNKIIYEQKEDLRLKMKQFSAITDNMSEGFLLVDYNMQILSFNQSAVRFFFDGKKAQTRLKSSDCDLRVIKSIECALAGERTEMLIEKEEGFVEIIASPVVSHGQVIGGVIIALDVTERHQRDELRKEFSANVSHELKTPLTSITGFAELMRDGLVEDEKIKEFSGDIYKESHRLLSLVNDIIRLSKLDEGALQPEKEIVELLAICNDVKQELCVVAEKKNVIINVTGDSVSVSGARQILLEMIFNLCDNAVKYNKNGGSVTISAGTLASGAPFVKVSDTGIGIPLSHQNRVFERFYRVDKSHSKEIGGTGLGLSIVKHAAAYHGASVNLKSEVDVGTEVTIVFKNE